MSDTENMSIRRQLGPAIESYLASEVFSQPAAQVIPEAAVEAAVEAHCEGTMRAALEAAAPHMLAAAWSTCAVESARCGLLSAADALILANRNPYTHDAEGKK